MSVSALYCLCSALFVYGAEVTTVITAETTTDGKSIDGLTIEERLKTLGADGTIKGRMRTEPPVNSPEDLNFGKNKEARNYNGPSEHRGRNWTPLTQNWNEQQRAWDYNPSNRYGPPSWNNGWWDQKPTQSWWDQNPKPTQGWDYYPYPGTTQRPVNSYGAPIYYPNNQYQGNNQYQNPNNQYQNPNNNQYNSWGYNRNP